MKKLLFFAALLMTACGGGSANGLVAPPVVIAQSSFSDATLDGTYVFSTNSGIVGSLIFNGAGFITGGSLVGYTLVGSGPLLQCGPISVVSGSTYSVSTTGALQVSLTYNFSPPNTCGAQNNMIGLVQQNGQGFVFVGGGASAYWEGTALKQ